MTFGLIPLPHWEKGQGEGVEPVTSIAGWHGRGEG